MRLSPLRLIDAITGHPTPCGLDDQGGILVESGLTRQVRPPRRQDTQINRLDAENHDKLQVQTCMLMDVRGDERLEGPIFNYARVFTWSKLTGVLHNAFFTTVTNIENGVSVDDVDDVEAWTPEHNLVGDAIRTAEYCGLQIDNGHWIRAYPDNRSRARAEEPTTLTMSSSTRSWKRRKHWRSW